MEKKKKEDKYYLPRDISWMYFNRRILQEAMKERVPILERLSFLGIYSKMLEQPREMGEMTLKDFVPMSLRCQMRSNRKSGKCKEKQNIAGERFANHYPRRCKI